MAILKTISDGINSMFGGEARAKKAGKPTAGEVSGPQGAGFGPNSLPIGGTPFIRQQVAGATAGAGLALDGMLNAAYPGLGVEAFGTFWGWGSGGLVQPRKGSYATYRLMSLDPTINLVIRLIKAPILASQWTVDAAEGKKPKQAWIDFVKDQILPQRLAILREGLRYLEFGWRPFERVYKIGRGGPGEGRFYELDKVKPLLPEFSAILHDQHGSFAGLTIAGLDQSRLDPDKAWIVSNDAEAGNLYGLSRHEAAFDPWLDSQYTRLRKALLAGLVAGRHPVIYYKPGKTPMSGGSITENGIEYADNFDVAKQMLSSLFAGKGAVLPTVEYSDSELMANPKLAEITQWRVDWLDAGNYAPAMDGFIHENEYQDKLKCRGWGMPERAALEATSSGSRADSEQHSDNAGLDIELIDDDLASQVSIGLPSHGVPGLVDELLALNFGEETRGTVVVKPAPLSDPKVALYSQLIETVFANPALAPSFAEVTDWEAVFEHMDLDATKDIGTRLKQLLGDASKKANQIPPLPMKPGGPMNKGQNGNGKANGKNGSRINGGV